MENGQYYIYLLKKKIVENSFLVNINVNILPKEDGTIIVDAFFRNGLCLHFFLIIISIFVLFIEKQLFKSTDVFSSEDSTQEVDDQSSEPNGLRLQLSLSPEHHYTLRQCQFPARSRANSL